MCYQKTELQEHVVVGEPGACYLMYVSPRDGREIKLLSYMRYMMLPG